MGKDCRKILKGGLFMYLLDGAEEKHLDHTEFLVQRMIFFFFNL